MVQARAESRRRKLGIAVAIAVAFAARTTYAQHVHERGSQTPAPSSAAPTPQGERKVLYWYDPMHPKYRSDKPGTAPDCGMDLVPKYAEEAADEGKGVPGAVRISPAKQQLIGVRTVIASRRTLTRNIQTVGIVQADETRVHKVHTKFPGWVDKLFVDFTGRDVKAGEPILSIYSPDLVSTQAEYLLARRGHEQLHQSPFPEAAESSKTLLDAARRRLLLWDITPQQIRELEESGKPQTAVTLHSPVGGIVTVKDVYQGVYVTPEMELYAVTDLSRVWVVLDLYAHEMASVRAGMPVNLSISAYPGEAFTGSVAYVYPYLDGKTRTNKVRVQMDNPDLRLKPDMYANAEIRVPFADRLAVPENAVLDSGTRQVVFVVSDDGYFQPREVRLGQRADGYVEVLDGVADGERVVTGANFMVDSESQLKAALGAMEGMPGMEH
ncbi:MAG: efflux RND transporter periplasmic adaptor subunit [Candidatus Binatia bacterium]